MGGLGMRELLRHRLTSRATFKSRSRVDAIAEAVEFATLDWVDWFNNRRRAPVEFEQGYHREREAH
jgi:hypothetical protein